MNRPEEAPNIDLLSYGNYHQAVQWVDREASKTDSCVSENLFFTLHKLCMKGVLPREETGYYRRDNVRIVQAIVTPPDYSRVPELMKLYITDYQKKLEGCREMPQTIRISEAVDLMAWGHYIFTRIHPFSDGNGRVTRLCCDFLCRKFDLRPIIWPKDREVYLNALSSVDKSGNLDNLGLMMAKLIRFRYDHKRSGLTFFDVIEELEKIINEKSLSVSEQASVEDFDKIWRGFTHPCFT